MLEVTNLTLSTSDGKHLLAGPLNFRISKGESLGIVGESGSGKTITALSTMQLLPDALCVRTGNILYRYQDHVTDLAALSEKTMEAYRGRHLAMIFQEPMSSLNPSMRCGHQILEAVRLHHNGTFPEMKDHVIRLLKETELAGAEEIYRKYPHQLSGGQRQRVMIAMALAGDPELLIADEPTTALDVTVQRKILDLLERIRLERKMSMLFISHDLGVIRKVCDRSLVMYKGKIVESGAVEQLFTSPEDGYTRGLIACRPQQKEKGKALPTLEDFIEQSNQKVDSAPANKSAGATEEPVESKNPASQADRKPGPGIPLLEVDHLQTVYTSRRDLLGRERSKTVAVNDVSFNVYRGETVGLIGESGCGKSTLGKTLVRLIRAREGNIRYHGQGRIQYIFQDPYASLNPLIRAGNAISEVMRVHRIHEGKEARRMAAMELLIDVGLSAGHFGRYPHEFSGGQRQRIGLARALATRPELLILDESVSSLDVSVQARILNLLNELKAKLDLTYLFISHDLSVVRYMADRILVMKDGKLLEEGSGESLYQNPSHAYTRELMESVLD